MKSLFRRLSAVLFLTSVCALAAEESIPLTDSIAAALVDAGTLVATHVPATGACEVFDAFCTLTHRPKIYSYNEEVAYTIAHGAAIGGVRSVAILKSHGFAKAANSIVDSIIAGNTAGFVVLVFDDKTGRHSDTLLDTKALVKGTQILHVQPSPETAYAEIQQAFLTSEQLRTPVAVLLDSDDLTRLVPAHHHILPPPTATYQRDVYQFLLCPPLAAYQYRTWQARIAGLPPSDDKPPLPTIPDLPPKYQAATTTYAPFFDAFKKIKGDDAIVSGDTGTSTFFALPPYDCVDITTYYGGSLPLGIGLSLAGYKNVWAIAGDFAFIAATHMGLPEALQRQLPLKFILFHNGIASATGGQPIQPDVFENMLSGYQPYVRTLPYDAPAADIEQVLLSVQNSTRLEILVIEIP